MGHIAMTDKMEWIMRTRSRRVPVCAAIVVLATLSGARWVEAQAPPSGPPATKDDPGVVAVVDGATITDTELDVRVKGRLERLRSDEYALKRTALDELITERLLAAEAARRKVTVPELLQTALGDATEPSEVELRAIYDMSRERYGSQPEERAFAQIRSQLMRQRMQRRRADFIWELRRAVRVNVLLDAPRMPIGVGAAVAEGPANASVTLVEFSDFECPYCGQLAETLKRIRTDYKGRIRFAYRHLPLPMHPNAKKAAEVATCAAKQDRFWPMYDKLFESLKRVQVGDWTGMAREADVNVDTLKACLDSPDASTTWMEDTRVAESFGITGTPALFVNGRLFTGAVPYDTLSAAIEDELSR